MAPQQGSSQNPIVIAKNNLVATMQKETQTIKSDFPKLKTANEAQVKQYFARQLQVFCGFIDKTKEICQAYFEREAVPVSLVRAMEDYYTTLRVTLSEFPDVAMDEKLQTAIGKVLMPYSQVLNKMSKLADDYEENKRREAEAQQAGAGQ